MAKYKSPVYLPLFWKGIIIKQMKSAF